MHTEVPRLPLGLSIVPSELGYAADKEGNVYSCWNNRWGIGTNWVMLNPTTGARGYKYIIVGRNKHGVRAKGRVRYVHHLVLEAFVGPKPDGMECLHGCDSDGSDRTDNRLANIKWGTRKENMQDKVRHGTAPVGENHPGVKITDAMVAEMMERIRAGLPATMPTARLFASELNVSRWTVWEYIRPTPRRKRDGIAPLDR